MSFPESDVELVRQDVWTLLPAQGDPKYPWDTITEAYAQAVGIMQAREREDPTSWVFQAAIHGTYATAPPDARWNQCQHASWFFLPWHRMYVYYFELIARAALKQINSPVAESFALPYWNYDPQDRRLPEDQEQRRLPLPFREPTLPDGSPNPLYLPSPRRDQSIAEGWGLGPELTSSTAAMERLNFSASSGQGLTSFGGGSERPAQFANRNSTGQLEQQPHNVIHVAIGGRREGQCQAGLMGDVRCAALDPIFWLHHANIDRLWNRWLALGGGRANPTEPAWLTQRFTLYDEKGDPAPLTCAEVVDSAAQLGYRYDDDEVLRPPELQPEPVAASVSGISADTPESSGPPELAAATEQPIDLVGAAASVKLTTPPSTRSLIAADNIAAGARAIYLNVEDIEAEQNPGIVYGVYVDGHHVGNIALFGIELMNDPDQAHSGPPGFRHTFDITSVAAALSADGRWDPDAITVTFEPFTLIPPPGQEDRLGAVAAEVAERGAATPVRVGRVSLFVA